MAGETPKNTRIVWDDGSTLKHHHDRMRERIRDADAERSADARQLRLSIESAGVSIGEVAHQVPSPTDWPEGQVINLSVLDGSTGELAEA